MPSRLRPVPFTTMAAMEESYHGDDGDVDTFGPADRRDFETEIIVPGSFVVLQGNEGDGLSNTISSLPILRRDGNGNVDGSKRRMVVDEKEQDEDSSSAGVVVERPFSSTMVHPSRGLPSPTTRSSHPSPVFGHLSASRGRYGAATMGGRQDGQDNAILRGVAAAATASADDSYVVVTEDNQDYAAAVPVRMEVDGNTRTGGGGVGRRRGRGDCDGSTNNRNVSQADETAIQEWTKRCRKMEQRQRRDWKESLHQVPSQLLDHCMMVALDEGDMWWQSEGKVAILRDVPTKLRNGNVLKVVIGTLNPGSTVVATGIVHLDSDSLQRIPVEPKLMGGADVSSTSRLYPSGQKGRVQMIQVETEEGRTGFATLSLDGYPLLAPGLPSHYVDPTFWIWRVTCPAGAYVREGLDLNTRHIETLPYGSLVRITRRTINNQGLSRLRTRGTIDVPMFMSSSSSRGQQTPITIKVDVDGWCSELLNPLSGQRGIVAQPLPFPVPALYRVTLSMGAVIRQDVELSSPETGLAPFGSIVKVVGRAFSEHPVDKCIERLKLAGNGGWISVRLNRPPPNDDLVVELVDVDGQFDPATPGLYHLDALCATRAQRQRDSASTGDHPDRSTTADLSSIEDDDFSLNDNDDDDNDAGQSSPRARANRRAGNGGGQSEGMKCVVCLTSDRNATLVHGETGHIVCCLVCSRILKARGDKCPVCRLNIDVVIQHFYA